MSDPGLIEAFNAGVDRLNAGQSLEECLRPYPQYADELRSLLTAGVSVRQLRPPDQEVSAARERVRARLAETPRTQPIPPRRWQWSRLAMAAGLVLVLAVVLRSGVQTWQELRQLTPTLSDVITLTTVPTWTATPPVTLSATGSPSALPSATPSLTATTMPTNTLSATPPGEPSPETGPLIAVTNVVQPAAATRTPLPPCPPVQPDGWVSYQVQVGDTLSDLAVLTSTTVAVLQAINCLDDTLIVVEQTLFLPVMPSVERAIATPSTGITGPADGTGSNAGQGPGPGGERAGPAGGSESDHGQSGSGNQGDGDSDSGHDGGTDDDEHGTDHDNSGDSDDDSGDDDLDDDDDDSDDGDSSDDSDDDHEDDHEEEEDPSDDD